MEKLNITKFLKDCPQGMKLNCVILDNLYFDKISEDKQSKYPIFCFTIDENGNRNSISFTENGCVTTRYGSKCVIFPEGKTTWKGFHRPFKNGDIIYVCDEYSDATFTYVAILKQIEKGEKIQSHCFYNFEDDYFSTHDFLYDGHNTRFATEEEKEKLFKAIKDNGYHWNDETKTLEKLVTIFKVGDKIKLKDTYAKKYNDFNTREITEIKNSHYILDDKEAMPLANQYLYELVPNKFNITTLVPFESKVLVRDVDHYEWEGAIFGRYDGKNFFTIGGLDWGCCIPYEGNEHLFGTTDDCDDYYKVWKS